MGRRYLKNPFPDFTGDKRAKFEIDAQRIRNLICSYVDEILNNCHPSHQSENQRGDVFAGNAGIAYMFFKLGCCHEVCDIYAAFDHAEAFIRSAKRNAKRCKKRSANRCSFLFGKAGIYAVSVAISEAVRDREQLARDMAVFKSIITSSKELMHTKYGCDAVLGGRAGFLSGCNWLNDVMTSNIIDDDDLGSICQVVMTSGREYSKKNKSPLPLMYQYRGKEYLGAAHGLCSILHVLLDSPWFRQVPVWAPPAELRAIKRSVDFLLDQQDSEGYFPMTLGGCKRRLVNWCHGAAGAVYVMAKAYRIFKEEKYLNSVRLSGDLVWKKGFLRNGLGLCNGVAGSGYVFLLLFRLTNEMKYLYRAHKFMELLTDAEFKLGARTPKRPHGLYEGVAGTVCFLLDLLEPEYANFPFMNVFFYNK